MKIIKPNIKWNGGKGRELKTILPKLPQTFATYVEPFFGGVLCIGKYNLKMP